MTANEEEFAKKLRAVPDSVTAGGHAQADELIAAVVRAGAVSEDSLLNMVRDASRSIDLRLDVCWLLPRLDLAQAGDVLQALLSDPNERLRAEAATGLGLVLKDDDVGVLHAALKRDSSSMVRSAALNALGVISSPQSALPLMGILKNRTEDPELRADAAEALSHVRDECVVDVLIQALADTSPLVRCSTAYALGQQGDAKALPALREVASRDHDVTPWGSVASRALDSIASITDQNLDGPPPRPH